jgi:Sulfotransferase domain
MALKVIGSGLGRTGTKSLQTALNMLGFGPCHHMVEVFAHPESISLWVAAGSGRPDWETIFQGYCSVVDYPGAAYWRQLAVRYPDAKVLHSIRDPARWFESTQATIFSPENLSAREMLANGGLLSEFFRSFTREFRDHLNDREYMIKYFLRHTDEVKSEILPERLLIYEVGEGWGPLCRFLDVPVPDAPYPSENSRAEFVARLKRSRPEGAGPAAK